MSDKTVKEINLTIDSTKGLVSKSLLLKILNFNRLFLSVLFSLGCTIALLAVGSGNEATAPLILFLACISLVFLYLFLYVLRLRPAMIYQINKESEKNGTVQFKTTNMVVRFEHEEEQTIVYKDVKGQYWMENGYFLFIDSKIYHTVLGFSVDKESFDDIYILSSALDRKKVKLVQIHTKKGA